MQVEEGWRSDRGGSEVTITKHMGGSYIDLLLDVTIALIKASSPTGRPPNSMVIISVITFSINLRRPPHVGGGDARRIMRIPRITTSISKVT